jgi:uncharacterized protein (DUF305 family)
MPSFVALLGASALLACSAATYQAPPTEADHGGMDHGAMDHDAMDHGAMTPEVVIPAGVLYTAADVHFMQMMIAHHAQAIYMSHLAATHGADPRLLRFAQKIDQSQTAEIALMQGWLAVRDQFVPDTASYHTVTMPGMLTAAELTRLAAVRDTAFDRLFLESMIRHHEGALGMVADLLATPRAAQDVDVSVLANDIHLVQTAEIDVMHQMLANFQGAST